MIKRKKLKGYLQKRCSLVETHLGKYMHTKDQEELHRMRVQAKKTKSLLSLLEDAGQHQLMEAFRPLKKIFRHAGKIRSAYIALGLAKHYSLDQAYVRQQRTTIDEESNSLEKKQDHYVQRLHKASKKIQKKIRGIHVSNISEYLEKQLQEVEMCFESAVSHPEQLHKGRFRLKNLVYAYTFFQEKISNPLRLNLDYLDKLQDAIGKWHDAEMVRKGVEQMPAARKKIPLALNREAGKFLKTARSMAQHFSEEVFLNLA